MRYFLKSLSLIVTLLGGMDIHSEEECDILCRAGYPIETLESIDRNNKNLKNQSQKNTLDPIGMLVTNSEDAQKQVNNLIQFFSETAGVDLPLAIDIGGAYGQRHKFDLRDIKFKTTDQFQPHFMEVGNIGCNDSNYLGVGINDLVYNDLLYRMELLDSEYYDLDFECSISNISFSLLDITNQFNLPGPSSKDEEQLLILFDSLLSDVDISFEVKTIQGKRKLSLFNINLNNGFKMSVNAVLEQDMFKYTETWNEMVDDLLLINGITRGDIKNDLAYHWSSFFEYFLLDPAYSEMLTNSSALRFYNAEYNFSWSNKLYRDAALLSKGVLDAGILGLKTYTVSKMSKYELQILLENFGFDRSMQGLYLDLIYTYYSDFFAQAKIFANNPQGIGISLKSVDGIDLNIFYELEENPMLIFNLLNNMEIKIIANPRI